MLRLALLVILALLLLARNRVGRELVSRTEDARDDEAARDALRALRATGRQLAPSLPPRAAARALRALRTADLVERRAGVVGVSVGKGHRIELCVRNLAPPERLHVFLHELAHAAASSVGHTREHAELERGLRDAALRAGYDVRPSSTGRCYYAR